jgi:hypothetical protein
MTQVVRQTTASASAGEVANAFIGLTGKNQQKVGNTQI